jgi:hypothetical protein
LKLGFRAYGSAGCRRWSVWCGVKSLGFRKVRRFMGKNNRRFDMKFLK